MSIRWRPSRAVKRHRQPALFRIEREAIAAYYACVSFVDDNVGRVFAFLEFKGGNVPVALYDLENDPWETINVADDPAYARTRAEMAALLQAGWKAARPGSSR